MENMGPLVDSSDYIGISFLKNPIYCINDLIALTLFMGDILHLLQAQRRQYDNT